MRWRHVMVLFWLAAFASPLHAADEELKARIAAIFEEIDEPSPGKESYPTGALLRDLPKEVIPLLPGRKFKRGAFWGWYVAQQKAIEHLEAKYNGKPTALQQKSRWYQKQIVDAYFDHGSRSPKWDAKVTAGLRSIVQMRTSDPAFDAIGPEALILALDAGCDDPMMQHSMIAWSIHLGTGAHDFRLKYMELAAAGYEKHKYHPIWRCFAEAAANDARAALDPKLGDATRQAMVRSNEVILKLLPQVAADGDVPMPEVVRVFSAAHKSLRRVDGDWEKSFTNLEAILKAGKNQKAALGIVSGRYWLDYAWDARGSGPASQVKPEALKVFRERRFKAESASMVVVDDERGSAMAVADLLSALKAKGRNDPEFDQVDDLLWLYRGLMTDPDSLDACRSYHSTLLPRWGGSLQVQFKFAREAVRTGNFDGQFPTILLDSHWDASFSDDEGKWKGAPQDAYFRKPGVWEDIQIVCEETLKRFPNDRHMHQRYALLALLCGQNRISQREFEAGGNYVYMTLFNSKQAYDRLRKIAFAAEAPRP